MDIILCVVYVCVYALCVEYGRQWRIQDLREGGAKSIACNFLATPLINAFLKIAG